MEGDKNGIKMNKDGKVLEFDIKSAQQQDWCSACISKEQVNCSRWQQTGV